MQSRLPKHSRILAIAPSTRGFGFAVLEDRDTLVDWGVKTMVQNKNEKSIAHLKKIAALYQPDVIVLEDEFGTNRSQRIRQLRKQIIELSKALRIQTALLRRKQVQRTFFADGEGTKHSIATLLAERFSEELGGRLPPKRRPWMSKDRRMDIFEAAALALALRLRMRKSKANQSAIC